MQTLIFLLLVFLLSIFSVLLYFKTKKNRLYKLNSGECPTCGEKTKTFFDETSNTTFKQEVIKSRVLRNNGCSGSMEVEYRCNACGLKEVYQEASGGCSF